MKELFGDEKKEEQKRREKEGKGNKNRMTEIRTEREKRRQKG